MSKPTAQKILSDTKPPFPHPFLLFSLVVTIFCGGFALGLIDLSDAGFKNAEVSGVMLFFEGLIAFYLLLWDNRYNPLNSQDGIYYDSLILRIILIILTVLTILVCGFHFLWPKTAAGIGAVINLLVYAIMVIDYFGEKKWQSQRQTVQQ